MRRRIVVIGGGISGLAAAHRLLELNPELEVLLLEARDRLGGVLQSTHQDGALMEAAADGFLTEPDSALSLCQRLELSENLISTDPSRRHAAVLHRKRLIPIPPGFLVMAPSRLWPVLRTPLLSWRGKLRLALESLVPPHRGSADESLAAFVRRRLGREVFDHLVQPLLGGIYAGDCEQLSLTASMPRFRQMEQDHGSLIRAMRRQARSATTLSGGARYGQFASLREGMGSLIEALCKTLPTGSIRTDAVVAALKPIDQTRWAIFIGDHGGECVEADGVILAVPAHQAAQLTSTFDARLAELLGGIHYNSCAVISLLYSREQIADPLDGCGFVVPLISKELILSGSFASLKYSGRAPEGTVLLRVFVGGGCHPGLMSLPNSDLQALAHLTVARLLGIQGEPLSSLVARHTRSMPEYRVGHPDVVASIDDRLQRHTALALAGNAYRGIGIPHCIQSGESAALRVSCALHDPPTCTPTSLSSAAAAYASV